MYDVIVVGGGAAGLTASIYARRKMLKTLLVSVDIGGQTNLTKHIENYPGYLDKDGAKLMRIIEGQARSFGTEFVMGKVVEVTEGKTLGVVLASGERYESSAIILAQGKVPRQLGIPGEEKFIGRGVSTCAICDAPLFKDKPVAIVGGGNSALDAADLCSKFSDKVYVIHRRGEFRGDEAAVEDLKKRKNVEFVFDSVPVEVKGEKFVKSLVVKNVNTDEATELDVKGVFVEIGFVTDTSIVKDIVKINDKNEIVVNEICETTHEGMFACGDITDIPYKQTLTAAAQGAIAALSAYNYVKNLKGEDRIKSEW